MEAHVLHIGVDDCHRVAVLRSVGYRVVECASLPQLARALEKANRADAVFLTESEEIPPEKAISLARERSAAPVILFQNSNQETGDQEFDLVIPPLTSPDKWLREVGRLVEVSRVIGANPRAIQPASRSTPKSKAPRRYTPGRTLDFDAGPMDLRDWRQNGQ